MSGIYNNKSDPFNLSSDREGGTPNLYVIAGPNGSGKTTFVKRFLPRYVKCTNFVNADLIASGLSPFDPEAAAIKAGRLMLEEITAYAERGVDFAFETTLSGKTYVRLFQELKRSGYSIHLFYLWVPDVNLAAKRVAERAKMGGHDVPRETIRRRFRRGLYNLFHVYRPLVDSLVVFDNATDTPRLVMSERQGVTAIADAALYKKILDTAEEK